VRVGPQEEAWEATGTQIILVLMLLPIVVGFSWRIATVPDEGIDRGHGFVPPAAAGLGAEDEARLLNRSDFRRADLTWADLRASQLWRTSAKGKLNDTQAQGAVLKEAQLQGAHLSSASFQGANLNFAELQGANLSYAKLQGADLRDAQLQGADLRYAQLQGADLEGAKLQDADLDGAKLQGANLASAELWLAKFPRSLAEQWPAPLGLADVKLSAPTAEEKALLKQGIETDIADPELRGIVTARLDQVLRGEPVTFDDAANWEDYAKEAKPPSPEELARYHAELACDDADGTIATSLAARAKEFETEHFGKGYAKGLAEALLDENCKGGKALTNETRAALESLASAPE
jgi:hypothetical protein